MKNSKSTGAKTSPQRAADWKQANEIRSYLAALRAEIDGGRQRPIDAERFAKWLEWADWYADSIDPLTPTSDRPGDIPQPSKQTVEELDLTRECRQAIGQLGIADTDELHAVTRGDIDKLSVRSWNVWDEICRVLEGLGYDVAGRKRGW